MAKKKSQQDRVAPDKKYFEALKPYMQKVAVGRSGKNQMFSLCIKASFAKCYEFNLLVRNRRETHEAFFWLPTLRGICEDVIVLNFIKGMPRTDREQLIGLLMSHDIHSRIDLQNKFFHDIRPQQPVLRIKDVATKIADLESKIQVIWNAHGWPGLKRGTMPQIRQIAEKQKQPVLARLYDYLYRLTSGSVHFNVQSLLRSGWGSKKQWTFSTANFHPYYVAYARVYGAFLFCVYFEFFGRFLRPKADVSKTVSEIRKSLLTEWRWPEMVTFEEMNIKPPDGNLILQSVMTILQAEQRKRLIM